MPTFTEQFLAAIEGYLRRTGTKPTEFGRQALGDPSLVLNLRRGRSPRLKTVERVIDFIRRNGGPGVEFSIGVDQDGK